MKTRDCTLVLLDHGASVDEEDEDGKCSLHYACQAGQSIIIHLLLEFGGNVETLDRYKVFLFFSNLNKIRNINVTQSKLSNFMNKFLIIKKINISSVNIFLLFLDLEGHPCFTPAFVAV